MDVIMLAGGKGTRLRPYTMVLPKPLMPIGDLPILEVLMQQVGRLGVDRVTLAVGYLSEIIFAYLEPRRASYPFELAYVREETPLGTFGPVQLVEGIDDTFLLMNGDILTTLKFDEMLAFHKEQGATMTVAASRRQVNIDYGVLELDGPVIVGQREKPSFHYDVSMGIYAINPSALDLLEPGVRMDVPDLIAKLIARGDKVCAYQTDCFWLDIGRAEDYATAIDEFEKRSEEFLGS
ncbi:MAG: NDP-sugar pyrophosphorylase family protein [Myxococcota bacterium]|jgi:NDP-sugar pyrophosphorylase family protein